jgi:hypothetical protein
LHASKDGEDGEDGENSENGENGKDGEDGASDISENLYNYPRSIGSAYAYVVIRVGEHPRG